MFHSITALALTVFLISPILAAPYSDIHDVEARNYDNLASYEEDMRDESIANGDFEAASRWHKQARVEH
ncbi:MAG: hypothetical protein DHS80DRAFT_28881 [Piptocephalis tieghemiana]|nr:MAG: hypothetical protein DHS80DRAFT_28881 [Piptocephalis tieghemiana]